MTRGDLAVLAVLGTLAFAVRLQMALRGGGLLGIGAYDDGVHFAAAASLLHGRVPYRDFLLLHPPVIMLVGTPFAALGRLFGDPAGLVAFRVAFELVGAANTMLVALVLRRVGRPAMQIGGVFYALFLPAVYDERTALLEPLGTTAMLLALLLVDRSTHKAAWAAGAVLGLSCGLKIWYVVPALVVVVLAERARSRILCGALLAAAVVYLPFLVAAGLPMVQQVVVAQMGRARAPGGLLSRLDVLLSVRGIRDAIPLPSYSAGAISTLVLLGLALAIVIAWRTRRTRTFAVLLISNGAVLLAAPSFFPHYAALTAAPLALVVGSSVGRLTALPRSRFGQAAAVLSVLALVVAVNARPQGTSFGQRVPTVQLQAAAARTSGCITSDDPTLLAVMNVLTRDLDQHCPLRVDPTGYSYGPDKEMLHGHPVARIQNTTYQRSIQRYLLAGDAFVQVRPGAQLTAQTRAVLGGRPLLIEAAGFALRAGRPTSTYKGDVGSSAAIVDDLNDELQQRP